jgi:hypothetical protein
MRSAAAAAKGASAAARTVIAPISASGSTGSRANRRCGSGALPELRATSSGGLSLPAADAPLAF